MQRMASARSSWTNLFGEPRMDPPPPSLRRGGPRIDANERERETVSLANWWRLDWAAEFLVDEAHVFLRAEVSMLAKRWDRLRLRTLCDDGLKNVQSFVGQVGESKGLTILWVVEDAFSPLPPWAVWEPRSTISDERFPGVLDSILTSIKQKNESRVTGRISHG